MKAAWREVLVALAAILALAPAAASNWWDDILAPGGAHGRKREPLPPVQVVHVVKVLDGDTVLVREFRASIRLSSIDAPEISHGYGKPGQPFSQASKRQLTAILGRAKEVKADCRERDRNDRLVCDLVADGASVGRTMVAGGYAWAYQGSNGRYLRDRALPQLQHEAQAAKRGLWGEEGPVEPWAWRAACWKKGECPAQR